MKNKRILPFAVSSLMLALSACGGEKTTIHEDPNKGIITGTSGCSAGDDKCHAFVIDYPVAGLNFDCSTDNRNHFVTEMDGNVASGGCALNDSVSFYIEGSSTNRRITLGTVDLSKINPANNPSQPARISLLDIAQGMTKAESVNALDLTDPSFRTMVSMTRMFQAIGINQNSNLAGDVQPIELTQTLKNNLSVLNANVEASQFQDGTYETAIKAWLDLSAISENVAQTAATTLVQLKNVNLYSASFLALSFPALGIGIDGFHGESETDKSKRTIANFYTLTDRQGFSTGYTVQWTGVPETSIGAIARNNLINQVAPKKLDTHSNIRNWINPLNNKIEINNPLTFINPANLSDHLDINQGTMLSQSTIAGNEYLYKNVTRDTKAPTNSNIYGSWTQVKDSERFNGNIDVYQTNPATYLDNRVFQSINNVASGQNYIFPLYANLVFSFDERSYPDITLGIVIDEHGDIRTNLSQTSLSSEQCTTVNANNVDTLGVQQYRIGTTGAASYGENDKSITLRIILANPIFAKIDGALIGLNENLIKEPTNSQGSNSSYISGGIRMNVQNLLVNPSVARGINITGWGKGQVTAAEWVNIHSVFQSVFNNANPNKFSEDEADLAKRQTGTLSVRLPACYTIKQK